MTILSVMSRILTIALLTSVGTVMAQAPAWQLVVPTSGSNQSKVTATATDAAGSVYLAGNFGGSITLGTLTLTSVGNDDIFVAKWRSDTNQFEWAQRAGGPRDDRATAIAVAAGGVYVAGSFQGATADFGRTSLLSVGSADLFVAKLADAGSTTSFSWAIGTGGTDYEAAYALAVSGGAVYVAGNFQSAAVTFGAASVTNSAAGTDDLFVAKLTDAGTTAAFAWVQRAGGPDNENATALAVNGQNVYVAGNFAGPSVAFGNTSLSSPGSYDVFVAKLLDTGNAGTFAWALSAGGSVYDKATALAVVGSVVYVAGEYASRSAAFASTNLTNTNTGFTDVFDVFVAQLTDGPAGASFTGAWSGGGPGDELVYALAARGPNVYIVGSFSGPATAFGSAALNNAGRYDLFVAKLTAAGFVWAQSAGGSSIDEAYAVALGNGVVYVAGSVSSPARFGSLGVSSGGAFVAALPDAYLTSRRPACAVGGYVLFPNPACRDATLAGTAPHAAVVMQDVWGREIVRATADASGTARLALPTGLAAGVYVVHSGSQAQRLAVE